MLKIQYSSAFSFCVHIFLCYILISAQDVPKLPYCNEEIKRTELIFVSTLDGLFTALNPSGTVSWQVETGPGPLLTSNIHNRELTKNGQWLRIIPSLSGSLYKFDGITIDPIPISADTLLTSSFRYLDDLVIAGGREVRTYGVLLNSGTHLYECSLGGCKNTSTSDDLDDIVIIERTTHTVRAVEPRTGAERWNFSVGQHNIKIPYVECIDVNMKNINFNITAVLPEGLLTASKMGKFSEILWQHKFEAPIVSVWKWNGRELVPVNLFNTIIKNGKSGSSSTASIYVGMHNKQLYVHESATMENLLQLQLQHSIEKHSVIESRSLTQIPWKPIPATGMNTFQEETDDSTALSVLYGSEYVNGNGYYLYIEEKTTCENNVTATIDSQENNAVIWRWWKEMCVLALSTVIIGNVVYNYRLVNFGLSGRSKQSSSVSSFQSAEYDRNHSNSESSDVLFASRYATEFEPISCLGKGGFGVVFQAKKKFDECDYAVKRITLANRTTARNRMMREVKALAKLDHSNIVRYYNAWLESPPDGWQQEHDKHWLTDLSTSGLDKSVSFINKNPSLAIDVESSSCSDSDTIPKRTITEVHGSSIIFESDSRTAPESQLSCTSNQSEDQKHSLQNQSHSLNLSHLPPTPVYLYIQMQLCCKESLKDWLCNNPGRDLSQALSIFEQIVDAVEYVHFRGLIHRDLKPSNIFFSLEGQIKVGDFGLVTSIKEYDGGESNQDYSSTTTFLKKSYTDAVGTQLYMSPEQLMGQQYDYKVDIYSLGIIFFELLVPFRTEMERMKVLTDLRNNTYPKNFTSTFYKEHELLDLMLANNPVIRPQASEIRTKLLSGETSGV